MIPTNNPTSLVQSVRRRTPSPKVSNGVRRRTLPAILALSNLNSYTISRLYDFGSTPEEVPFVERMGSRISIEKRGYRELFFMDRL